MATTSMWQRVSRHCAALATRSPVSALSTRQHAVRGDRTFLISARCLPLLAGIGQRPIQRVRAFSSANSKIGPMNADIRSRLVQLVGDDGKIRRDVPLNTALAEAKSKGVDIVQVASNNGQPVCRLFDAQKRLFNMKKAIKNSKPKQDKEVVFGVKIEAHDIKVKAANVRNFLSKGHKVKVTVKFGKEFHLKNRALDQLTLIEEIIGAEVGGADHKPYDQYGGVYTHFMPKSQK